MTSPLSFSTLTPIPGPNELPPITTSVFTVITPENTPHTHRVSTSANPNPMISPAFVEANYEILESLLRESPRIRRQRERAVEFENAPNKEGGGVERNFKGRRPSEFISEGNRSQGMNLPPLLAAHLGRSENGQPLQSSLASVHGGSQPSTNMGGNLPLMSRPLQNHLLRADGEKLTLGSKQEKWQPIGLQMIKWKASTGMTMSGTETPDRRSRKIKTIGSLDERNKEGKGKEEKEKLKETSHEGTKDIPNRVDAEERIVINDKYPKQTIAIGKQLLTSTKMKLQSFLRANADVFAWTPAHMTGIPRTIMIGGKPFDTEHRLNELKHIETVKQKKRSLKLERNEEIRIQVEELMKANILREVKYHTCVSNPIIVKKANEGWKWPNETRRKQPSSQEKECSATKGRNLEVHFDDMIIKSNSEEDMLADIKETFKKLQAINMKLNPKKCSFEVKEGPFLGHPITKQGIKANPLKVKAISDLQPPKIVKDIQNLNKRLATLSQEAFRNMKEFIEALPMVTAVIKGETLVVYLATSEESISVVLLAERGKKKVPVYFVSRTLQGAELEYPELEKLILALVYVARRIQRYFQAHHLQILADFLAETSSVKDRRMKIEETKGKEPEPENTWKLFTDRASRSDGSGAGLMLVSLEGKEYTYAIRFEFKTTNNEAEYEALLAGLRIAKEMKIQELAIFIDS
ncbi:reverse transcriptase domain-containing protein [Tanacetum coccineum]